MSQEPCLRFYDVEEEITVEPDASQFGLGAVLLQQGQPVAYASRTLTQAERNYAQIEKELLSVLFACESFDHFINGKESIQAITDHRPLESIFMKPLFSAPKRLQRMRLRLLKYPLKVKYQPGHKMYISDTLSRAPIDHPQQKVEEAWKVFYAELEETDHTVSSNFTDCRLEQVRTSTQEDPAMQVLISVISKGWPQEKSEAPQCVREYWNCREDLVTQNGIIYKGDRIVIPKSLRHKMLQRVHRSHQENGATLSKARSSLFWPHMNSEIKDTVSNCSTCQEFKPSQSKEPMAITPVPQQRW